MKTAAKEFSDVLLTGTTFAALTVALVWAGGYFDIPTTPSTNTLSL